MSEQPNHPPSTPIYSGLPEIHVDNNGNTFSRNTEGRWVPYHGPLPTPQQTTLPSFRQVTQAMVNERERGAPSSPFSHAFRGQDQYQFALHPVPLQPIPIDPALIPLPNDDDRDLTHGRTIANAKGFNPLDKIAAAARRRSKGKGKAKDTTKSDPKAKKRQRADSGSESEGGRAVKRGRPSGSGNYSTQDVGHLFDIIAELLPVGQRGWTEVTTEYNKYAEEEGYPPRVGKALENKYKNYLKQKHGGQVPWPRLHGIWTACD
ncbi:hypothetical protein C8R46DRAFT_1235224 [Mycena filopes]|nr:hypothetical protein C8R46DRAFT_1235224 [Mycena filopes]